jgi:hypothetical protein
MSGAHIVHARPPVEFTTGVKFAYSLRGLPKPARADKAINGVPALCAPYTDGQLAALFHVSRPDLKSARQRTGEPSLKDVIRKYGVAEVWDALTAVLDER